MDSFLPMVENMDPKETQTVVNNRMPLDLKIGSHGVNWVLEFPGGSKSFAKFRGLPRVNHEDYGLDKTLIPGKHSGPSAHCNEHCLHMAQQPLTG